jgi:predicted nucleic acid-binding protein
VTGAPLAWCYVETSALLEWLLAQPDAAAVHRELELAPRLVTSALTLLEVARALGRVPDVSAASARSALQRVLPALGVAAVDLGLFELLARPFAVEPVRTLDAIHLCTAVRLRAPAERVGLLALDRRVRDSGRALGFVVRPG